MKSRSCPKCSKKMIYKTDNGCKQGIKNNTLCQSCATIKRQTENPRDMRGDKNPFFGKKHSLLSKEKMSQSQKTVQSKPEYGRNSLEFKKTLSESMSGDKNNMYGKSVYSVWIQKYGIEEANKKLTIFQNKLSEKNKGAGNPMYGKPAPNGSGNGWKGWYKGWFFRSLRELSYMINVIEKEKLTWVSAETKKLSIHYVNYDGCEKTYRADFLINNSLLIEIKPIKLHNTPTVNLKRLAAVAFCQKNGFTYQLVDPVMLTNIEIKNLVDTHQIKFTERFQKKYEEKYEKTDNNDICSGSR